jgi:hypothetical protein
MVRQLICERFSESAEDERTHKIVAAKKKLKSDLWWALSTYMGTVEELNKKAGYDYKKAETCILQIFGAMSLLFDLLI